MWVYEKKLQYPVRIKNPNPQMAQIILTQYGGPDGELGASLRYLSQRFSMPNEITKATLNDIGSSCSKCSHIHLPVLLHNLRQISRYMGAD